MGFDMVVFGVVVAFLLMLVLVMQMQLNSLSKEMDERQRSMNEKVNELLKKMEKESKIT
jgi:F0F1-type ATP synthase membrane subunit b/b'